MKAVCNGIPLTVEKNSLQAELELGTVTVAGHRSTHKGTGVPGNTDECGYTE